ncbi:MAG: inositol monophosphatase [Candidatus Omnitrophica bacterium]|nr:inositol monophosphatase [Candidatus Omnitrophota bacterium]
MRESDSSACLAAAVEAAQAGGKILLARLGKLSASEVNRKGATDWVTAADHASEAVILRILKKAFPDHSVKAEESSPGESAAAFQWLVDPLDGTSNYIHSFPAFCVSIALAKEGKLEAGVVFDPLRRELFTARRGRGAYLNGRRIHVSKRRRLSETLLATGFPVKGKERIDLYLASFRRIFLKTGVIRRAGSAALDLAYTACGRADGFWEMCLAPWDMAAGALLVTEAGGRVSDFFGGGRYLESGNITAGNAAIHPQLVKILAPLFRSSLARG